MDRDTRRENVYSVVDAICPEVQQGCGTPHYTVCFQPVTTRIGGKAYS